MLAQIAWTLISLGFAGDSEAAQEASNGCFLAGTPVLLGNGTTKEAINDIQVGQRVATDGGVANSPNGKTKAADPNSTKVNPKTWRLVTIEAGDWEVQTLEPLRWIRRHHLSAGSSLLLSEVLDLAEMGVPNGLVGQVDSISACPAVAKGHGRVVLTTVSHLNDFVFHLTLAEANGQTDTIGITEYHKVYTEDRGWVDADDLQQGEYVETADGEAKVDGLVADPGLYRVYNMSVEADHVYYVGDAEALVHNTCSPLRSNMEDNGTIFKYTEDAHHIVAQNDPAMAEARQLLKDYKINIHDPINGVPLDWVFHQTVVHGAEWPEYAETVTEILGDAADIGGRQGIIDALGGIAKILRGGNLP